MSYAELFQISREMNPNGGVRLSPSECGFLVAEVQSRVKHYEKEMLDSSMSATLRCMCVAQVEGMKSIVETLLKGMDNRG